jgi:hypothetical protein
MWKGQGAQRSIGELADEDSRVYIPGWKLQYQKLGPNTSFEYENTIFHGLASCPPKPISPVDLDAANDPDAIVKFYLTYLRSWCLSQEFETILTLIRDGALRVEGKALIVPPKSKFA